MVNENLCLYKLKNTQKHQKDGVDRIIICMQKLSPPVNSAAVLKSLITYARRATRSLHGLSQVEGETRSHLLYKYSCTHVFTPLCASNYSPSPLSMGL